MSEHQRHDKHVGPPGQRLDRQLQRALRTLPREGASPGFTERLLERLEETPPTRARFPAFGDLLRPPTPGWAAGLVLAALAVAALVALWPTAAPPPGDGPPPVQAADIAAPSAHPTPGPSSTAPAGASTGASASTPAAPSPTAARAAVRSPGGRDQLAASLDQLRREHLRLERDLRDLRQLAEGSRRIYLGGDETLDLVLELDVPVAAGEAAPARLDPPRKDAGGRQFY